MAWWNSFTEFLKKRKSSGDGSNPPLSLKDRFRAMRNLPAFFRLVWQTNPSMALADILLRVVRSAIPLMMLYVGKLIVDEIVQLIQNNPEAQLDQLWVYVGIEFGLAILSDLLSRSIALLDSLLGDLFANHTSVRLMEHAASLDLDQFEDSAFYDKLERARQQTLGRTVLMSQSLSQFQDLITILFLAVGLIVFNFWLIVLLIIAVIPAFLGESHFNERSYSLVHGWTPERRELDYLRYTGASDETAKELKIFGLSGFLTDRFTKLSTQFYEANKSLSIKRAAWGSILSAIGTAGYYAAYVFIIFQTLKSEITLGELTFLSGSFARLRTLLETILNRFSSVAQGALYLQDLFDFFNLKSRIEVKKDYRAFPNPIKEGFVFENVGFKYQNSEKWANRQTAISISPCRREKNWHWLEKTEPEKQLLRNLYPGCMSPPKEEFFLMVLICENTIQRK
jgi:ATP-binding cassette, subfamily B, bacterial